MFNKQIITAFAIALNLCACTAPRPAQRPHRPIVLLADVPSGIYNLKPPAGHHGYGKLFCPKGWDCSSRAREPREDEPHQVLTVFTKEHQRQNKKVTLVSVLVAVVGPAPDHIKQIIATTTYSNSDGIDLSPGVEILGNHAYQVRVPPDASLVFYISLDRFTPYDLGLEVRLDGHSVPVATLRGHVYSPLYWDPYKGLAWVPPARMVLAAYYVGSIAEVRRSDPLPE